MDPVEPNIDPILTAATNGLGMAMVWRMTNQGFHRNRQQRDVRSVVARRGSTRCTIAARVFSRRPPARGSRPPIDLTFEQLGTGRGYDARVVSWNYPRCGREALDVRRHRAYQVAASWALFLDACQNRRAWLEGYAAMADRALGSQPAWGKDAWPSAVVIPKTAARHAGAPANDLDAAAWPGRGPRSHGSGHRRRQVVSGGQLRRAHASKPFGGYAKALCERQHYPDLFDYPGRSAEAARMTSPPTRCRSSSASTSRT
jgi:hypothetical protein